MGCSARILACVDRKVDQLVITNICIDHNHEMSSDLYKQTISRSEFIFSFHSLILSNWSFSVWYSWEYKI